MTPVSSVPPVNLSVDTAKSCNGWNCCMGCKCSSPTSPASYQITEKTIKIFEKHRTHHRKGSLHAEILEGIAKIDEEEKKQAKLTPVQPRLVSLAASSTASPGTSQLSQMASPLSD